MGNRVLHSGMAAAVCGLFLFSVLCNRAFAQLVLNEVYYDHPGRDDGHEFVELLNISIRPIAVSSLSLQFHNGSSTEWVEIWRGESADSIEPQALYLIGGDAVVPTPQSVSELGLQNGPEALRLLADGVVVDLLGYGDLQAIYCEGSPAPDVEAGRSLARIPDGLDTDDNSQDLHAADPSPGAFNLPERNVALRIRAAARAVLEPGQSLLLELVLHNEGIEEAIRGAVEVALYDSTGGSSFLLDTFTNGEAIEPGDSLLTRRSFLLVDGYHFIRAQASLEGDERPGDDFDTVLVRVGGPEVLVSEVMCYPREGAPQYIELYNASKESVNIEGWRIRDRVHSLSTITSESLFLSSGSFLVVTENSAEMLASFRSLDPGLVVEAEGSWPVLNRTGEGGEADSIVIADRYGLTIEALSYPPQPPSSRGKSLERVDLYPGAPRHIWLLCTSADGGTPGEENSVVLDAPPQGRGVVVHPNPFSPGVETLFIEVPAVHGAVGVSVAVFDLSGSKMRDLGQERLLPTVFVWNGERDDGILVPGGIYILACQWLGVYGSIGVERVVVGCGKRRAR